MENELNAFIGEDVPVTVFWEYEPAEKQTWDYPGCPDAIVINEVRSNGEAVDVSESDLDTLEGYCRDWLNEQWAEHYAEEQQER